MSFRLYPIEQHWCSFADYGAILSVVERLQPQRVLEFGPGSSTLALIEGGARHIDALEDQDAWLQIWHGRLSLHAHIAKLHKYQWSDPLTTTLDDQRYELGLIDGPVETPRRYACVEYCLQRCDAVLVPLEEHPGHQYLRPLVLDMAARYERSIELIEDTGPLAGAFVLLT